MHAIFAVEPEAVNCWKNFRYLIEKFGFPNGVLIARYPKSWMRLVIDACDANNVGDVERLKIVEKLRQAKEDRMLNESFPFAGGSWLENALQPAVVGKFDGLILRSEHQIEHSYCVDDIPEEVFHDRRETRVPRDAKSLASAAGCLLVDAKDLVLIDPYLRPKRACANLLNAFIELALERGRGISRLVIHMAHTQDPRDRQEVVDDYQRYMREKIANGLSIQINRWNDSALDFDFHARYLLTDKKVGLRYDRGFNEPPDHDARNHETDIVCMERATVNKLLDQYQAETSAELICDVIYIE